MHKIRKCQKHKISIVQEHDFASQFDWKLEK